MKLEQIADGIFHVKAETAKELGYSFVRPQEYYENAELQANMVDISGNTVRQFKLWKGSNTISTQNLSPGLYFLKVQTQMGNGTYKFIKQ